MGGAVGWESSRIRRIDDVDIFYLLGVQATGSMTISCPNIFESDVFTFTVLVPREGE